MVAYLLGSIPSALLFVRMAGKGDVRKIGSGNVGATSAMRAGWKVALPVMVVDVGDKGVVAVLLMRWLTPAPEWHAAAGLAAILGHCFPVWLGFVGGKGMATAGGIFLVLAWLPALAATALWIVLLVLGRRVSLASVLATAAFPPPPVTDQQAPPAGHPVRRRRRRRDHLPAPFEPGPPGQGHGAAHRREARHEDGRRRRRLLGYRPGGAPRPPRTRGQALGGEPEVVDGIGRTHRNPLFLPDLELPEALQASGDVAAAVAGSDLVVFVVPARQRQILLKHSHRTTP